MRNHHVILGGALGALLFSGTPGNTQPSPGAQAVEPDWHYATSPDPSQLPVLSRDSIERFTDGVVGFARDEVRIPGVVVSVVKDGELLFAKGYGWADEINRIPVDPERTRFYVASISKTFTFTALMQLVERQQVSLEDRVAPLLGLDALDTRYEPVTVRQLMTHSAGFEDAALGFFMADGPETDWPLMDYVGDHVHKRVRPNDQWIVYSNYGSSVAGAVIEQVSGVPFEQYLQEHVLDPLGMHHSAFQDSATPDAGDPERAVGHRWRSGRFEVNRNYYHHHGANPAGGLATTATDMAKFMLAHLDDGSAGGNRLLQPATQARMHSVAKRNHPSIAGNAHGFWSSDLWGYQTLRHAGATKGFMSDMVMVPELNLGVFISTNSQQGWKLMRPFASQVLRQFFPTKRRLPAVDPDRDLSEYAGLYLPMRRNYSRIESIGAPTIRIRADRGYLIVPDRGAVSRFIPQGEDVFVSEISGSTAAVVRDSNGRPRFFLSSSGSNVLERIGPWQSAGNFITALGIVVVFSILVLLVVLLRRLHRVEQTPTDRGFGRLLAFVALLWLIAGISFFIAFGRITTQLIPDALVHFPDTLTVLAQWVMIALVICVPWLAWRLFVLWKSRGWHWLERTAASLYVAVSLTTLIWATEFNLIGFRY